MKGRLLLLALLLTALAFAVWTGLDKARRSARVAALCDAAAAGDEGALAGSADLVSGIDGAAAASCRCRLHLQRGDEAGCVADLEAALQADDAVPPPGLVSMVIRARAARGDAQGAATLASAAARAYPDAPGALQVELEMRSRVEPERDVLDDLAGRLSVAPEAREAARAELVARYRALGATDRALKLLGDQAPATGRDAWFEQRMRTLGRAADAVGLRRELARWIESGGPPASARALYALILDEEGLEDPERSVGELYIEAVDAGDAIADPWIREAVRKRLIIGLVRVGRPADALALYDEARAEFELAGLTREEIAAAALDADADPSVTTGELRFPALPGAVLRVSPDADEAVDAEWTRLPLDAGATVTRARAPTPVRWVVQRGADTVASGTTRVRRGGVIDVDVAVGEPTPPSRATLERAPPDGRRRVFALVVDCLDWRLLQYLRTRGELPVIDALLDRGRRAVLWTDPPYTAAAMKALVHPGEAHASVLSVVHELGLELAGLESVEANPVAGLRWLLPTGGDLFGHVGAGPHAAVNLLFPHGAMEAGDGGTVVGPKAATRALPIERLRRPLTDAERAPGLPDGDENIQRIAAAFDTAVAVAGDPSIDLVLLRVEAFDIATHGTYALASADGQDDGRGALFAAYRYADARIADVARALDADDVLVLLSDHGIRTAMEHDHPAVWVAVGPDLSGRVPGRPGFEGVPRALVTLLGAEVPESWPNTGL